MTESAIDRLCSETGISRDVVEGLGELDDTQLEVLRKIYANARDKREKDLLAATDAGLEVVPRLLRPAVKKVLFS
ncbi:hypothetical protein FOS14_17085 [Skermania sp. ID1734]|uniref:hypothetical protein n=1 Tax=Skermania sp. ID1734 TaxID=2597516 RepID=UPI00117CE648|nr:hypothetical protein [Skermania sp. ID1734]TSD96072.1 hypothetical protein FOS14_17085 [Skermania sp. ID1734]